MKCRHLACWFDKHDMHCMLAVVWRLVIWYHWEISLLGSNAGGEMAPNLISSIFYSVQLLFYHVFDPLFSSNDCSSCSMSLILKLNFRHWIGTINSLTKLGMTANLNRFFFLWPSHFQQHPGAKINLGMPCMCLSSEFKRDWMRGNDETNEIPNITIWYVRL